MFDFFGNCKTKLNSFNEIEKKDLTELKITEKFTTRTAKIITEDETVRFRNKSEVKSRPRR